MFVVTRRVSESLLIGHDIVVTVTHIRGKRVRIAVNAPTGTPVGRLDAAPGSRPPHPASLDAARPAADRTFQADACAAAI